MKILLINNYHYLRGGSERAYFDTAKILETNGHEVAFFSTLNSKNIQTPWSKFFVSDVDLSAKLNLIDKIKAFTRLFGNSEADKKLGELLKKFKPDVAHLHNIYHHLSPSIIKVLKKAGIPMVLTLHDYQLISPNRNLLVKGKVWEGSRPNKFYQCLMDYCIDNSFSKSLAATLESYYHYFLKTYQSINCFISPSYFLIKKFREFGFSKKINYLPNPVFLEEIVGDSYVNEDYILYYGRLSEEKGILDLLKSFGKIDKNVCLNFVGDGPLLENLKKSSKNLIGKKIKFFGRLEGEQLWGMIKGAKLVVVPSRWYENAPYSILESMILGKAVLAADIGGMSEIIKDGINGFVFKAGDVNDLESKLRTILEKDDKLTAVGLEAQKRVKINNSPYNYYQHLMDIYFQAGK